MSARAFAASATAPLWTRADTMLALRLLPAAAVGWLVPERYWPGIARTVVDRGLVGRVDAAGVDRRIAAFVGDRLSGAAIAEAARASMMAQRLLQLQTMRALLPGLWRPATAVHGLEHVRAAQAAGRGVVLWVVPTAFSTLAGKLALRRAGLAVHHLSRFQHPFTESRLGAALLNPLRCGPENRWLAGRVMIERGKTPVQAMRVLGGILQQGSIVSITLGALADRPLTMSFLDGQLVVAPGAPRLAARAGAALLPVITLRGGEGFVTTIEPPIGEARELVPLLERLALEQPGELYWYDTLFRLPSGDGTGGAC